MFNVEIPHDMETWVRFLTFVPIVACSVAGFAVTLAKWVQLRKQNSLSDLTLHHIGEAIKGGHYGRVLELSQNEPSRLSRIIADLLRHVGGSRELLKEHTERAGSRVARDLEYGLGGLALIATLGPLFGLFGTVVGIILVFDRLSTAQGVAGPQELAGGIGTALYTTVAGLIVGILALLFHGYLQARVDTHVADLEEASLRIVDELHGDPP